MEVRCGRIVRTVSKPCSFGVIFEVAQTLRVPGAIVRRGQVKGLCEQLRDRLAAVGDRHRPIAREKIVPSAHAPRLIVAGKGTGTSESKLFGCSPIQRLPRKAAMCQHRERGHHTPTRFYGGPLQGMRLPVRDGQSSIGWACITRGGASSVSMSLGRMSGDEPSRWCSIAFPSQRKRKAATG